ncbi:hypothetical protein J5N97_013134 [Dioscorea zingiberensis]|uniref:Uncharacterized protein n=1 Tax=Dioscorea zingiberensis TaxID=325984 RepID=A0A9D5CQ58_9LILI|nr:hypothetical protein J5N97_013134 [Dioscorea zingiberensis]
MAEGARSGRHQGGGLRGGVLGGVVVNVQESLTPPGSWRGQHTTASTERERSSSARLRASRSVTSEKQTVEPEEAEGFVGVVAATDAAATAGDGDDVEAPGGGEKDRNGGRGGKAERWERRRRRLKEEDVSVAIREV